MNRGLSDVQAGFRKSRGARDQTANICWIIEKQENSRKTSTSASFTTLKPLTLWITTVESSVELWKVLKELGILLGSEGEGEGGMIWENGILSCILSCKN